ncbi:MAG TPA: alpha-glucuronidase family glycosyl hydrolase [Verrucomicrobiae bacterium]
MNHEVAPRIGWGFLCGCLALWPVYPGSCLAEVPLVKDGKPGAAIILDAKTGELTRYAATELQDYIAKLSGVRLPIVVGGNPAERPAAESLILLGRNGPNRLPAGLVMPEPDSLKAEGFVLKTFVQNGRPAVVVSGKEDAGTLYGAYELLERLGITFRLTGDIVPARTNSLALPELDVKKEPAFPRRGFLHTAVYDNLTMYSWPDYEQLLNQMCRMKCNYLQFWWFSYTPWLKFSYRGETKALGDVSFKESGYHTWAFGGFGTRTIEDVSIGREHFKDRPRMAPLEMQRTETPEEAFAYSTNLLQRFIAHAARRNIKVWLAVELGTLPPNLARFSEIVGDAPFNYLAGSYVHPLDPVNREIQVNRLKALRDTFPGAEGVYLNFAENYQDLAFGKYRDFFEQHRAQYQELRTLYLPWSGMLANFYSVDADRMIDSNIAYFDLFSYLLKKRDEVAPGLKLGLMTVGRGYALPLWNRKLPAEVPFASLESSGVWTPAGMPMEYFGGMGQRERVMQPRIDDDFEMFGMQFNVRQFVERDHIAVDGFKHGLSGFAGQVDRPRGTEYTSSFLAEAGWEPDLTAERFYRRSAERIFGLAAAEEMTKALLKLEEHQLYLNYYEYEGGYGILLCCSGTREVNAVTMFYRQKNPYAGPTAAAWRHLIEQAPAFIAKREGSIRLLDEALSLMRAASSKVLPQSRPELDYLVNRTESYRDFFAALNNYRRGIVNFDSAFRHRTELKQEEFVAQLESGLATMRGAFEELKAATQKFSLLIDHVSDLAVLYNVNARIILGTDLSLQFLENVVNYHRGKPFLKPVNFERLFPPRPDQGIER